LRNKTVSTYLEPLVGLVLGSLPSTEGLAPSSSLRRLVLSLSLSKALDEDGRLLEPENETCSAGGVLMVSDAWEDGEERLGTNESCWET
jgi:hypothetical protein